MNYSSEADKSASDKRCVGILRSTYRRSQQTLECLSWVSHASVSTQRTPTR